MPSAQVYVTKSFSIADVQAHGIPVDEGYINPKKFRGWYPKK